MDPTPRVPYWVGLVWDPRRCIFNYVLRWDWYCWSWDHTLRTTVCHHFDVAGKYRKNIMKQNCKLMQKSCRTRFERAQVEEPSLLLFPQGFRLSPGNNSLPCPSIQVVSFQFISSLAILFLPSIFSFLTYCVICLYCLLFVLFH